MKDFKNYDHLFDKIEQRTNANQEDLFQLADSLKDANFQNEHIVRNIVKDVSSIVNMPISEDDANSIVEAIVNETSSFNSNNF